MFCFGTKREQEEPSCPGTSVSPWCHLLTGTWESWLQEHPCKERAPAPWDHMDLRLERCGCEGEKGRPWEHGLASIQCSVLDTGESSRLLGSRTPAQALVVTLTSCLNCHKLKNYLERKYFKMF